MYSLAAVSQWKERALVEREAASGYGVSFVAKAR
jgi:hypothetical protein